MPAFSASAAERPRIVGIPLSPSMTAGCLQLYDRNYTRTEIMIRKPVRTACCSPNLDDFKQ
jgi:hypothetical protein